MFHLALICQEKYFLHDYVDTFSYALVLALSKANDMLLKIRQ